MNEEGNFLFVFEQTILRRYIYLSQNEIVGAKHDLLSFQIVANEQCDESEIDISIRYKVAFF